MVRNVFVIAGPSGAGKDSIIKELIHRYPGRIEFAANATTRPPREGEVDGVNYFFMSTDRFQAEVIQGNIPEHYYRAQTNTYYGLYKPRLDAQLARGVIVAAQVQIVGARYLQEQYNAITIFIVPSSLDDLTHRIFERSEISAVELSERVEFTKREVEEEAPQYDYRITNDEGKLDIAVDQVVSILKKEGFVLG